MKYTVTVPVTSVSGNQRFTADAKSPEEACRKVTDGDCTFHEEEIEVTELDFANAEAIEDE